MRGRALLGARRLIRYYITDRHSCPGDLLDNIARQAADGVEYIQLREKDLSARELLELARGAVLRVEGTQTRVLVNERADVALAAGAHGVHLRSQPIAPVTWRAVLPAGFLVAVSCHNVTDIAEAAGADFAVFGPVFEVPGKGSPMGLKGLEEAAQVAPMPLLALGGITEENAASCIAAGAAGIAAIRLFQQREPIRSAPGSSSPPPGRRS